MLMKHPSKLKIAAFHPNVWSISARAGLTGMLRLDQLLQRVYESDLC